MTNVVLHNNTHEDKASHALIRRIHNFTVYPAIGITQLDLHKTLATEIFSTGRESYL